MKENYLKILREIQLNLEGLHIINENKIIKAYTDHFDIEKNDNLETPQVIAMKTDQQIYILYADSLSQDLYNKLHTIDKENFISNPQKISEVLKNNTEIIEYGHYITYILPKNIKVESKDTRIFLGSNYDEVRKFDGSFYGKFPIIYAIMKNEEIAACCVSSRENDKAGEGWVFTLPEYRQQGFGIKAVQLRASELHKKGKIAFYTHKKSNTASQKLAEKLQSIKIFETITYE